jgi:hypothetical protein
MNQTGFQDMMGNETIVDAARMNANCGAPCIIIVFGRLAQKTIFV